VWRIHGFEVPPDLRKRCTDGSAPSLTFHSPRDNVRAKIAAPVK